MESYTTSFTKALLSNKDIKRALMLKQVQDICLKQGLITLLDVESKSKQYRWMTDIVDDHLMGAGLLRQLTIKHAQPDEQCELLQSIVHDIVARLMSHQQPYPRRQ